MALQQNINLPVGVNLSFKYTEFKFCTKSTSDILPNAYIKIDFLNGSKEKIILEIGIYSKKDGIKILSDEQTFNPSVLENSSNFIKQGYEYLKTLDKYKDSVDLLDDGQTV